MKLSEFMGKPLADSLESMEMVSHEVHTDDAGNVKSLKLKYVPKSELEEKQDTKKQNNPRW